jgi:serine/threonine protein kinase
MQIEEIPEKFEINGKTYINTYKKFGESSFGDIFQVRADDEKQDYILKRSKKYLQQDRSDKSFKMLQTEYDLLSIIAGCPHIIRVKEISKDANHAMMLLEYAKGGELFDYINDKIRSKEKIDMKTFENLFKQLILAVKCFHLLGVYNRDITTTNILFLDEQKTELAIIDFGLGIHSADDKCIGLKGSGRYIAPEVNVDDSKEYKCSKADIFSLGTVLSELLLISKPANENENEYYQKMKTLIEKMTHENPEKRITLNGIVEEHTLFYFILEDDSDNGYGQFKSKKRLCKSNTKKSKQIKRKSKSLLKSNSKKYNYPKNNFLKQKPNK